MGYWDMPGRSDDWYTPAYIFEALGVTFDMDVAAPVGGIGTFVPAATWISANALAAEWRGFVWMNPPYGGRNGAAPWLDKFFAHGNGIACVPDRTSAPWFQEAWPLADGVLFTPKIKFFRPDGSTGDSPANGTALLAAGDRGVAALLRAARRGLGVFGLPTPTIQEPPRHD
jgi:hypothetical protein